MNKASGGDEISAELFQILNDDDVKVLHSISQQIWKTQQWPQDWKRSVFIVSHGKPNLPPQIISLACGLFQAENNQGPKHFGKNVGPCP